MTDRRETSACTAFSLDAYMDEWDAQKGFRHATQKAIKGGSMFMTAGGNLTEKAMEGMVELVKSWEGLTRPK